MTDQHRLTLNCDKRDRREPHPAHHKDGNCGRRFTCDGIPDLQVVRDPAPTPHYSIHPDGGVTDHTTGTYTPPRGWADRYKAAIDCDADDLAGETPDEPTEADTYGLYPAAWRGEPHEDDDEPLLGDAGDLWRHAWAIGQAIATQVPPLGRDQQTLRQARIDSVLWGSGFIEETRDDDGNVTALRAIDPRTVTSRRATDGHWTHREESLTAEDFLAPRDDQARLRAFFADGITGHDLTREGQAEARREKIAADAARAIADQFDVPLALLPTPGTYANAQDDLNEAWERVQPGLAASLAAAEANLERELAGHGIDVTFADNVVPDGAHLTEDDLAAMLESGGGHEWITAEQANAATLDALAARPTPWWRRALHAALGR